MYAYVKWIFVLQLFIVYTFAAIAKLYADWLDFSFIRVLMDSKADYFIIGEVLQQPWLHKIIGISGILFDLLVVPALLWKPSRKLAFIFSIIFHLFNSVVFQIGIFPYLSLAFIVFFYEPETIRRTFFKNKVPFRAVETKVPPYKKSVVLLGSVYFMIQLLLPIRHYFIKDDVIWTEEGHRMSWRMMLRSRSGSIEFTVVNKEDGTSKMVHIEDYLTKGQKAKIGCYPDFIWQFAQYLKEEQAAKGRAISVYVKSEVQINGKEWAPFIDPYTDLANVPWDHFRHHDWILPSPVDRATKK